MSGITGWAAKEPKTGLQLLKYDTKVLGDDEVEVSVEYCGLCHSDVSIANNDWGLTQFPVIPGHEAIGQVSAIGKNVKNLKIGDYVGVGWHVGSCMHCELCLSGEQNLCSDIQPTIIGNHGGFAEKVRTHWMWAIPIPRQLDVASAGPLLCAGATVFAPLLTYGIKPTDRVGIVGIGGLGHLALQFANAWGCEVTAFTSNKAKSDEAHEFGAHHVVDSTSSADILSRADSLDFLLVTVNSKLDWSAYVKTLKKNGKMAFVGLVLDPMEASVVDLVVGQKLIAGSANAGPAVISKMLEFAARHSIAPMVEHFPMSKVNEAIDHLLTGKARYRVVLDADFN